MTAVVAAAGPLLIISEILSLPPHLCKQAPVPMARRPTPTALPQQFLMSEFAFAGGIGLRYWRDEFHSWDGTAYHADSRK